MQINDSISVDCVIFGFDGTSLKCLLIERADKDYKLPGNMIRQNEDIQSAAYRVLEELTGLKEVFLQELSVFSDPNRICGSELDWINNSYQINTTRVVTVAYYALVKLNAQIRVHSKANKTIWADIQSINRLAMDHKMILVDALSTLNKNLLNSPIAFELLPKKFTIRQLENLYKAILGVEIDNRNFRKKILDCGYIICTGEREKNVAHKPALYYTFDKNKYKKELKNNFKLNFLNWHY